MHKFLVFIFTPEGDWILYAKVDSYGQAEDLFSEIEEKHKPSKILVSMEVYMLHRSIHTSELTSEGASNVS